MIRELLYAVASTIVISIATGLIEFCFLDFRSMLHSFTVEVCVLLVAFVVCWAVIYVFCKRSVKEEVQKLKNDAFVAEGRKEILEDNYDKTKNQLLKLRDVDETVRRNRAIELAKRQEESWSDNAK